MCVKFLRGLRIVHESSCQVKENLRKKADSARSSFVDRGKPMSETLVVNGQVIELVHGDITDQHVDAIVNAANSRLAGGAGVDGAIRRRCLELAIESDCRSIAFPAISTGVYGYPVDQAAAVAIGTSAEFLREHGKPNIIRLVLFSREALETFAAALLIRGNP